MKDRPNFLRHFDMVNMFHPFMVSEKNGLKFDTFMGDFIL